MPAFLRGDPHCWRWCLIQGSPHEKARDVVFVSQFTMLGCGNWCRLVVFIVCWICVLLITVSNESCSYRTITIGIDRRPLNHPPLPRLWTIILTRSSFIISLLYLATSSECLNICRTLIHLLKDSASSMSTPLPRPPVHRRTCREVYSPFLARTRSYLG